MAAATRPELDFLAGDRVTATTSLPRLCRAFGAAISDEATAEQLRLAMRGAGLLTVEDIRARTRKRMIEIIGATPSENAARLASKLSKYLRYEEEGKFAFVSDTPEQLEQQRGDDDEEFAAASPSAAAVLALAQERGRPEARAERHAARQQLDAEADKWAPGSVAMLALAQGFLNPDTDARLARAISPARVPGGVPSRLCCPAGHVLTRTEAGVALRCDGGCGEDIPRCGLRFSCVACDFDMCAACAN
jgi:hypothetical protein